MRTLLRNRYLDGTKWILQGYWMNRNHPSPHFTRQQFQYCRTMVVAAPTEQVTKPKREKVEKKPTKRSSKKTPKHIAVPDNTLDAQTQDVDEPPLSPWLRQLWRGDSSSSSNLNLESSNKESTVASMIATSEVYALASPEVKERKNLLEGTAIVDFDTFDDSDDPESTKQKPKRTGGSGNNFDGKGYDGLGGASTGDDKDGDDPDALAVNSSNVNSTEQIDRIPSWDKVDADPKDTWPMDPNLYPHIRTSLTDIEFCENQELLSRDTGLAICTLGTSAGGSCRLRSNSATVVRSGSFCYLIDAGEGVQRQFMLSRLRYNDISKIFITHMHADHVFGLASILLCIQIARTNESTPRAIEIYGPVGLYNYVAMILALTCTEVRKIKIFIYELHGGTQRSMRFSGNRKAFPEFQHKSLARKSIPQNADGTWTLVEPMEITTPELAATMYSTPTGFSVKAAEIHHIPELQCFGYTFQEPMSQPRPLNIDSARSLGVSKSASFRMLKSGFSVMNDDKSRLIHADEVCGEANRPRKITVLGDCSLVPPAMEGLATKSDVLVHEATLSIHDTGKKVTTGGHSTAAQAAIFANKVKAQVLILNHLPKALNTYVKCKEWLYEAESRIRGPTRVQLGYDHLEIVIPRNGFNFSDVEASKSIWPEDRTKVNDTIERIPRVNGNQHVPGWR